VVSSPIAEVLARVMVMVPPVTSVLPISRLSVCVAPVPVPATAVTKYGVPTTLPRCGIGSAVIRSAALVPMDASVMGTDRR
jgi:hypothetical protein